MRHLWLAVLVGLSICGTARAQPRCPADAAAAPLRLPHFRTALAGHSEALVVALGSSSTEGAMASDPGHAYPAVLQAALSAAWPTAHVAVINRGIGGEDAPEEIARLQADVIAIRPNLVIWQVGANGALRDSDPATFTRLVTEGVHRLTAAGIDVILMDNQRAPRILASPDHTALEAALTEVAKMTGTNLFSRGRLMDAWAEHGEPPNQFIASDGLHHNDFGYRCIAMTLAQRIEAAVTAPIAVAARH